MGFLLLGIATLVVLLLSGTALYKKYKLYKAGLELETKLEVADLDSQLADKELTLVEKDEMLRKKRHKLNQRKGKLDD